MFKFSILLAFMLNRKGNILGWKSSRNVYFYAKIEPLED